MSWNNTEYSAANGQPVTLFEFVRGGSQYFRYTSADRDIIHDGITWTAEAISHSGISQNTGGSLEISVPSSNAVAGLYRGVPPSDGVAVRVAQFHYTDETRELKIIWLGTVTEIKRQENELIKIISASVASTFSRNGLRLTWGRSCPHALYDHNCRVNKSAFAATGVNITSTDGAGITVNLPAGVESGYFSGGYIEFTTDEITERRGARVHSGNYISLLGGSAGLAAGAEITLYPGCDKTTAICDARFNNLLNFGGVPHLPGISPYQIIKLF